MAIETVTPNNWNELNDFLFENTWNSNIGRHRSNFAYRGLDRSDYPLTNSLTRLGKPYPYMESHLLKQFKKYAYPHFNDHRSEWYLLSVAQHHGLPTRLLDWTYSPLVALHFATSDLNQFDADGVIWKVNYAETNSLLPGSIISKTLSHGANILTVEALSRSIEGLHEFDQLKSPTLSPALFFEPPSLDSRIVNQFAYFSAISDPFMDFELWLRKPDISQRVSAQRILVASSLKWEIRDKLDQSNVTERVLFPGLDGLSKWLRRHYFPRP